MQSQSYDVFFSGQIMEGRESGDVRQQIGRLFKASEEQLQHMFSGKQIRIKSGVDQDTAIKYRVAFRNAGALVEIKPTGQKTPSSGTAPTPAATSDTVPGTAPETMTLLPPNSGTLEECAPKIVPQPIPDISSLTLAREGSVIDKAPDPSPPHIDTGNLTLGPAKSGTLEDCQKTIEPEPIPDISHLRLDKPST